MSPARSAPLATRRSPRPCAVFRATKSHHADQIATKANTPLLAAALARAGIGRIVLPTFIGTRKAGLTSL